MNQSDVFTLSQCIDILYNGRSTSEEKEHANALISRFSESEDGWYNAIQILQHHEWSCFGFASLRGRRFLQCEVLRDESLSHRV